MKVSVPLERGNRMGGVKTIEGREDLEKISIVFFVYLLIYCIFAKTKELDYDSITDERRNSS